MSYLFQGMDGLHQINQELIYAVARRSMSIETNFDIVLPLKRTKPTHTQAVEDAVLIHQPTERMEI